MLNNLTPTPATPVAHPALAHRQAIADQEPSQPKPLGPPSPIRLRIFHTPTQDLSAAKLQELWDIYSPHHNTERAEFEARITQKMDFVTCYQNKKTGELLGMTAVRMDTVTLSDGTKVYTVYSGMSYISPACRGMRLLPRTLARYGTRLKLRHPFGNVWLWSDAISYKPYVLSARSARTLYPSRNTETPPRVKEFMDWVGTKYYGTQYNAKMGTVRKAFNRLKDHVAPITEKELADPDIRFFAERNPGYQNGDGLLNVIPLSWGNMATSTLRAIQKSIKKRKSR